MIFYWSNIDSLSQILGGQDRDPRRVITSNEGTAQLIEFDAVTGLGYVENFLFTDGLAMVVFNCEWSKDHTFNVNDEGRCRVSFTLDLNISMDLGNVVVDADMPAWRISNNAPGVVSHESVPAGGKSVWVTLAFHSDYLDRFLSNPSEVRKLPQFQVFRETPEESLVQSFPLDHQLNLITSNIISLNAHDSVYLALAKAKATELLSNALDRLLTGAHGTEESQVKLRTKDRQAIKLARDILINNPAEPPTIRELCAAVGVNRNKLNYGFKEEFGMAPLHYLDEYRLEQAYRQLRDSDDLIYQIAADAGYNSQGSFSTAFKRKYGITPKKARSQHKQS